MDKKTKTKMVKLVPSLRGVFGSWVYYSSLLTLQDVASHVKIAEEIHSNKKLSDMIQRELKRRRAKEIADYLCTQSERFLNSLVVAVYGGEPKWYALSEVQPSASGLDPAMLSDRDLASVGFLELSGEEVFFTLDGQHRLAGIRKALEKANDLVLDEINVLFVAHKETLEGRQRTRRLFTTLNKRAKPVSKGAIIALDEDDTMAIICRRLVEEHDWFSGEKVAYQATNNMPVSNQKALTTIGALYDLISILFCKIYGAKREELKYYRPSDKVLDNWYDKVESFFVSFYNHFSDFREFCDAGDSFASVTKKYRNNDGGSVLFRPIGLIILVEVVGRLRKKHKNMDVDKVLCHISKIKWNLNEYPFRDIIWNSAAKRMETGTKVLCIELVLYVAGVDSVSDSALNKYVKAKGVSQSEAERFVENLTRLEPIND